MQKLLWVVGCAVTTESLLGFACVPGATTASRLSRIPSDKLPPSDDSDASCSADVIAAGCKWYALPCKRINAYFQA